MIKIEKLLLLFIILFSIGAQRVYAAAPTVVSAGTNDVNTIVLTMSEPLSGTQGDAFALTLTGINSGPMITNVSLNSDQVILTLDSSIISTDSILISYTPTGTDDLTNGETPVEAFNDFVVTNLVPPILAPTVTTDSVDTIDAMSAYLYGTITDNGGNPNMDDFGFQVGTDTNYLIPGYFSAGNGDISNGGSFSIQATGLTCATEYHFRASATNAEGTGYGEDMTFTTLDCPMAPTVTTDSVEGITKTTASVSGTIQSTGGDGNILAGFNLGLDTSYSLPDYSYSTTFADNETIPINFTDLTCSTEYHFRAFATNSAGTGYGEDRTFTTMNCNTPIHTGIVINYKTLTVTYDINIDPTSIPDVFDFTVQVNSGNAVGISGVSVSGAVVTLTLDNAVLYNDSVAVSYGNGTKPLRSLAGILAPDFASYTATNNTPRCDLINVGSYPVSSTLAGTKLYVTNSASNNISVIDTANNTVISTISVGGNPRLSTLVGTKLYVSNADSSNISVIDTTNNTVISTIPVSGNPSYSILVGTKLYVSLYYNKISVIDTTNNTVIANISVGNDPQHLTVVGTKLYVNNYASNNISVIDTANNTVISTISVGGSLRYSTLVGTKLYVSRDPNYVSVIDTTNNTVISNISVSSVPIHSTLVGTKLYVSNNSSHNVSVIDTANNTVIATIPVISYPRSSTLAGTKLYVNSFNSTNVSVIDTTTNAVTKTIITGGTIWSLSTLVGAKLYVPNFGGASVSVIDIVTDALFVCDTIHEYACTYTAGSNGSVTGDLSQTIVYGENATEVTAVPNANYHFLNWSDASTANPRTDTNVTSNISVTANFAIDTKTVTFNKNTGDTEASPATRIVNYNATTTLPTPPTKSGYTFDGWYTGSDGSGTVFNESTLVNNDLTVYAKWVVIPAVTSPVVTPPSTGGGGGGGSSSSGSYRYILPALTPTTTPLIYKKDIFTTSMFLGNSSSLVSTLQTLLTKLGYYTGPVTGYYGPLTEKAVKKYQVSKNIEPLGFVGPATRLALNAEVVMGTTTPTIIPIITTVTTSFNKDLSLGMTNSDVTRLQTILYAQSFLKVSPTGYFGNLTLQAVKDYQKAHSINPTGYVGPVTRVELGK